MNFKYIILNLISFICIFLLSLLIKNENYVKLVDGFGKPGKPVVLNIDHQTQEIIDSEGLFDDRRQHRKNFLLHDKLVSKGKTIFDVTYATDEFGRRKTHRQQFHDEHILLVGCSFVFGWGLKDQETISSLLQYKLNSFSVYNYGVPGGSANDFLAQLEKKSFTDEIHESSGMLLYFYNDAHVGRFFGEIDSFKKNASRFILQNGVWRNDGTFAESQPYRSYLKDLIRTSWIFAALNLEYYNFSEADQTIIYCKAVVEMKRRYLQLFKHGKFLLVFHPLESLSKETIKPCLKEFDIDFFESSLGNSPDYLIPIDDHPSAYFNRKFSEELARVIVEKKKSPKAK